MAEEQLGSVGLLLAGADVRHFSLAPAAIELGAVRFGGWQVHPIAPAPDRFPGTAAYLVKITFDLVVAPNMPAPHWVDVGFTFDSEQPVVVMDVVPGRSRGHGPARSYRVDRNLSFVEVASADSDAVHLPEVWSAVTVYGVHSPKVRWRHDDVRAGSHTAWLVLLTAPGTTNVNVKASVHYDVPFEESFGNEPVTDPVTFHLDLVPGPATPVTRMIDTGWPTPEPPPRPRVFISYAHEDSAHMDAVLAFATFLVREEGIDVVLDRWGQEVSRDWNLWAIQSLKEADFVLLIASPTCKAVGEGYVDDDHNRGLQAEMALIREAIYRQRSSGVLKYLPVVLPGGKLADLPDFIQPWTIHNFHVTSFTRAGAENLLRTLTRQPAYVRPEPPAYVPPLPPHSI